jgi:hypothetical protein
MRTLGTRRTVLVAGAAAMAAVALAGCSAGQVAETSLKRPTNMGVNGNNSDNSVLVRNLVVPYNGPTGYLKDQPVPLQLALFNQSTDEVRVTVTSLPPSGSKPVPGAIPGSTVTLSGPAPSDSATPAATPSATPTGAPAQPAVITLPPSGSATFLPGDTQSLQISGLSKDLRPGDSVYVTFSFSNGAAPLALVAPVGVPASPAPRASGVPDENSEG